MTSSKQYLLGDLIIQRKEKNNNYSVPILGVCRDGFIEPKQKEADTSLYNVFYQWDFVFNPARMEVNSIALNTSIEKAICSSLYEIFYISRTDILLPEYLNLIVKRDEFARLCAFLGSGSAREYCRVDDISRIKLTLPPIAEQIRAINAWKTFREIKEQNEAIAEPLMQVCQSYIQGLKHRCKLEDIGGYIQACDCRNSDNSYTLDAVRGLSTSKEIIETKANMDGVSLSSYKIFEPKAFAYVPDTSRRGDKVSMGFNDSNETFLVSSISSIFKVVDSQLLPEYLFLWFCRPEFDRYARFNSWGSAREAFNFEDMQRVQIPIPSVEEQQAIVDIYQCSIEAKRIAEEADRKSREICPALIQYAINH